MDAIDLLLSILTSPSAILWDISMMAITIALLLLAYMPETCRSRRYPSSRECIRSGGRIRVNGVYGRKALPHS